MGNAMKYEVVEKRWVNRPMHSGYDIVSTQEIITDDLDKVRALAEITATEDTDVFVYGYTCAAVWAGTPRMECVLIVEAHE